MTGTTDKDKKMKTVLRTVWPQVRTHVVKGTTYYLVDCRRVGLKLPRKTFCRQEDAFTYASGLADKFSSQGAQSFKSVGSMNHLQTWIDQLTPYGKGIEDAVSFYVEHLKKEVRITKTIAEYLDEWQTSKLDNKMSPLRKYSIISLKTRVNLLKKAFNGNLLSTLTRDYLKTWLNSLEVSNETRMNYKKALSNFFNYLIDQKIVSENPTTKIQIGSDAADVEFYSVEQCKMIAKTVLRFPELIGFFSICLFAGVRPNECRQMTWQNIDLEHGEIFIPRKISKVKKDRMIYLGKHQLDNLMEWLKFHKASGLPLMPDGFDPYSNEQVRTFKNAIGFPWINDGLRHSFCTYFYAKHQSYEMVTAVMGNSKAIAEKHYKGTISSQFLNEFWNMTPSNVA